MSKKRKSIADDPRVGMSAPVKKTKKTKATKKPGTVQLPLEGFDDLVKENKRLKQQVDDLQSGMYINCVYCGHRYGPEDNTPSTKAEQLYEHIKVCPQHPMSLLQKKFDRLTRLVGSIYDILFFDSDEDVYDEDKEWDVDYIETIHDLVTEVIPRVDGKVKERPEFVFE
jgi:hypothetical protein